MGLYRNDKFLEKMTIRIKIFVRYYQITLYGEYTNPLRNV